MYFSNYQLDKKTVPDKNCSLKWDEFYVTL